MNTQNLLMPDLIETAKDGVSLSKLQADAIGALRLIQLVGLEIEKLTGEYAELLEKIDDYTAILSDEQRLCSTLFGKTALN